MSERYTPELGQAVFGNEWSEYPLPEYAEAFLHFLRMEIERVWGNTRGAAWEEWNGSPTTAFEWRPYYWGEDETEGRRPNFKYGDVEVRWYKHLGRGTTCNKKLTANEWAEIMTACLAAVRAEDYDFLGGTKPHPRLAVTQQAQPE